MKRKDITDKKVCEIYLQMKNIPSSGERKFATELLMEATGAPEKVAYAAMMRAEDNRLIDCGVSLRSGWLTEKGKELLLTPDN